MFRQLVRFARLTGALPVDISYPVQMIHPIHLRRTLASTPAITSAADARKSLPSLAPRRSTACRPSRSRSAFNLMSAAQPRQLAHMHDRDSKSVP